MKNFTREEETIILEIANQALKDGEIFDNIADMLDLEDDFLKELSEKISASVS